MKRIFLRVEEARGLQPLWVRVDVGLGFSVQVLGFRVLGCRGCPEFEGLRRLGVGLQF